MRTTPQRMHDAACPARVEIGEPGAGILHRGQCHAPAEHPPARPAAVLVACLLSGLCLLCTAPGAWAQTVVTLVSNVGQGSQSTSAFNVERSQRFTTGSNPAGYTLSSVEIVSSDDEGDAADVSVCTVDTSDLPTSDCTALTPPSSFAAGTLAFTAPTDMTLELDADTTYALLITSGTEQLKLSTTLLDGEDAGAAAGWSIGDGHHRNFFGWSASSHTLRITIKGYAIPSPNTAPTVANAIPDQAATVGTAFNYTVPENTFSDADDDTLTYTATKADGTDLPGWLTFNATTRTFSGTPEAGDVGTVSVKVAASDGQAGNEAAEDTFDIVVSAASNTPATGAPTITGFAQDGHPLRADTSGLMDANGLTGVTYTYQWLRVDPDGSSNETSIGTNADTYTLVAADQDKKIKVRVSFTDGGGFSEDRTSAAYPSEGTVTRAGCPPPDYARAFTTGNASHGYALTSVWAPVASACALAAPQAAIWSADAQGAPGAAQWRLAPSTNHAHTYLAESGAKLEPNTTYFVVVTTDPVRNPTQSTLDPAEHADDLDTANGWSAATQGYERSPGTYDDYDFEGLWTHVPARASPIRLRVTASALSTAGAEVAAEPAEDTMDWRTQVTVGHWHVFNRERERGWRRDICERTRLDTTDLETHSDTDMCYGAIGSRTLRVGEVTYPLVGVYHFVTQGNDTLVLEFDHEVDLAALEDRTFWFNGNEFPVHARAFPRGGMRGDRLTWSEPEWTATMGWAVGSTIWVGLTAESDTSMAPQAGPTAQVQRRDAAPVHGPFGIVITFSEAVSGFDAADFVIEGGALVEGSLSAVDERTWHAEIAPAGSGPVVVGIRANAVRVDGLGNAASEPLTVEADLAAPSVELSTDATAPFTAPFTVRVTFSKAVSGFTLSDLVVEGAQAMGLLHEPGAPWYDVLLAPVEDPSGIRVTVPAGVAQDGAGRGNTASPTLHLRTIVTATFSGVPESHDGSTEFTAELHFSEEPQGLSYQTVGGGLLEVSGGRVTGARRLQPPSNRGWAVNVTPTHADDIVLTLPARACNEANAVCFDGQPLTRAASATVRGVPLTATLVEVPASHDGSAFTFELAFSEDVGGLSYETVRDSAFAVTGGRVTNARRLVRPRNQRWDLESRRLEARFGYGYGMLGGRFTATPELGVALSDTGREYRLGWGLGLVREGSVSMDFELSGTRREAAVDDGAGPEHALMLRGQVRW